MFELTDNASIGRTDVLWKWLPRLGVAVPFLALGIAKFSEPMWMQVFERIGFGDWFRQLTGSLQILGALLVLIPQTFLAGIFILSSTMVGAMLAWIVLLDAPGNAVFPGAFLLVLLAVGALQRRR
jgi:hypothetical protein